MDDDPSPGQGVPPSVPGYTLGARLGVGGSGVVWAATRDRDGSPVAVKVVTVGVGAQADAAVRELAVLSRVEVEGLVRFHEAVTLPGEGSRVALVLDLVGGGSLATVVGARGHLSVGESVTVLAPVSRALAGLHAAGVQHGDVTPGNVLLERSGRPLLADLGVARFAGEVPGEVVGTEGFVAPEVLDGGIVTAAADVYAAGALAWWCVTGRVPGPVSWRPPLESLVPDVPPAWRDATTRALAADPADRPTAAELALAWFDSAPCEPLRLVVGTDETSLLTHRLRRPPSEVVEQVGEVGAPTRNRSGRTELWTRWPRRAPRPAGSGRSKPAAALAGAVLTVTLVSGALLAGGVLPAPGWLTPSAPARSTPSATRSAPAPASAPATAPSTAPAQAPPSTASAPASAPAAARRVTGSAPSAQRDRRSPSSDTATLMQELASLRARAMVSGREADLLGLDAPGSVALAHDTTDLRRVRAAGLAYAGLSLTVRSARPVSLTERSATVEAVVDTAAYRVVSATGARRVLRTEPAVQGQALRFVLLWSGGRWLVERVEAPG